MELKARKRRLRAWRSEAFKRNVKLHGLAKAKCIAATITRKQKERYNPSDKDIVRKQKAIELGYVDDENEN